MPKLTEFHAAFARALAVVSPRVVTLDETASTNDDARALGRDGAPHLSVVVANAQTRGRGRLDRAWFAEPGEALLASWVVRPAMPVDRWTLLPLLAGLAVTEAVRARTGVDATLKWPNDVMVAERKLGGILTEAHVPDFAVIGLGLNASQRKFPQEIEEIATSLAREGAVRLDRADLLAATLAAFARALAHPDDALDAYRARCATLGRTVRVERAGTADLHGVARGVDASGALIVTTDDGADHVVVSADVIHLRARAG